MRNSHEASCVQFIGTRVLLLRMATHVSTKSPPCVCPCLHTPTLHKLQACQPNQSLKQESLNRITHVRARERERKGTSHPRSLAQACDRRNTSMCASVAMHGTGTRNSWAGAGSAMVFKSRCQFRFQYTTQSLIVSDSLQKLSF